MSTEHVSMDKWGKDHWSTLAYIETRCVDFKGVPSRAQMRCDPDVHPGLCNSANREGQKYPTKLSPWGVLQENHDDWSCAEDMEREGLLIWEGTGIHPLFKLTNKGRAACQVVRGHKESGGNFFDSPTEKIREAIDAVENDEEPEQSVSFLTKQLATAMSSKQVGR